MSEPKRPGTTDIAELRSQNAELRGALAMLEQDKARMVAELDALRAQLKRSFAEIEELSQRLERDGDPALAERYLRAEQHNSSLTNLYVASHRLQETLEREAVLGAIREIVTNLIGSEEFGVYELTEQPRALELLSCFGLDERRFATLPADAGLIGRSVRTGEILMADAALLHDALPHERNLSACIPLRIGKTVIGVIAIFSILPHKEAYTALDRELFDLLTTHAAVALRSTDRVQA
jgi:hypothetical protein